MTRDLTARQQIRIRDTAACSGTAAGLGLIAALMVALLAFLSGGQDAFRWRERAAQTNGISGQQIQSLPAREHLRAAVMQDRKDPPQPGSGDPAGLPAATSIILAHHFPTWTTFTLDSATIADRRLAAFRPRGPPGELG